MTRSKALLAVASAIALVAPAIRPLATRAAEPPTPQGRIGASTSGREFSVT